MSDFAAGQALLFAGEMFAASLAFMALAWLGAGARRASLRHLVWAASFGALLALPVLAVLVPGAIVLNVPAPIETVQAATAIPVAVLTAPTLPARQGFHLAPTDIAAALAAVWLVGVLLMALRQMLAALLLYRLHRDSDTHPFDDSELPAFAHGVRHTLRLSCGAHGPLTWGVFRPVILLPHAAQVWPHDRLQAVLRHEFAHVDRRDGLAQALAALACALYWPNPLVWLGARAMRREAEIAADDAVIASGMTPSDYAGELLDMAREFRGNGYSAALAMAAPSALPARVKSILAPTQQRSGVTSMDVLKLTALALLTTSALVVARPSFAQDAPSAPVAAAPPTPVTPATPATDVAPPVPPADAAAPSAPATDATPAEPVMRIVRVRETHKGHLIRRVRSEILLTDREVHDAMARVKPELDRVTAEVKAHEVELRQIEAMRPRLNAEIKKALADVRAQVALIKDAAVRAKADVTLARAQAQVDAAGDDGQESRTIILKDDDNGDQTTDDDNDKK